MTAASVGFVGLGTMGGVLASNLVERGFGVIGFDAAGPEVAPAGVVVAGDLSDVARQSEIVVLSLPDGAASAAVAGQLRGVAEGRARYVIDTSTIGVAAASEIETLLAAAGITYVDAPVSGGVAGARARTLSVMIAGDERACDHVEPILAGMSDRLWRVGARPGMGQALKLANNFLSATALAATSEALAFTEAVGIDMATTLRVLNASSGQNTATGDKFPNHVLTGRYSSGFTNTLMRKDVNLYCAEAGGTKTPLDVAAVTASLWEEFATVEPNVDFTRIFPFVHGRSS